MHASNFRPVKNIGGVIRTFRRIQDEVPANLVLIGEGPELPKAHDLVATLGIADRVYFLGIQEAIDELLAQTDLLLQPSDHESFGLTALEAMATGVPVVLTSRGGTADLIESGVSGLLADPEDEEGMAAWAIDLLLQPDRWRAVSEAARKRAVERFDTELIVGRYIDYYRKILG
jgi:N-acetyl-alpha-D-glucosaminyl L-malate synthase BshA